MKKKLLVLAIAGAFVAPIAMADTANVSIYGQANVSYDSTDNNPTGGNGTRASKVSSNASHIGFKGSEALSGGTSAIWQIETAVNMDNSTANSAGIAQSNGFGTRNTFAGLKGDWGSLVLGRTDSAYKIATRRLDLFDETLADNRSLVGLMDSRIGDVAHYASPNMSGFSAAVTVMAGAENATTGAQQKGTGYALSGMYEAGPLYAALAYISANTGTATTGSLGAAVADLKSSGTKLGAGYKMDQFEASFVYEKTKDELGVAKADLNGHNSYYLAGKYNISGSDAVKLAYARANKSSLANTAAKQVSLGYDHAMSKRTSVYVLYTKLNNDASGMNGLASVAEIESTGSVTTTVAGSDPSAISLGMKHTF